MKPHTQQIQRQSDSGHKGKGWTVRGVCGELVWHGCSSGHLRKGRVVRIKSGNPLKRTCKPCMQGN